VSPAGPAFRFFELHVQLADERVSAQPTLVDLFCPVGYFVQGGNCAQCPSSPSGSSTSLEINASTIRSCVCDIGSYGSHGELRHLPQSPCVELFQSRHVASSSEPGLLCRLF
jgi:hypothetical protein